MELRQLKYFLSVVRLGGIGAAADANYVTQPAVSLQIQKLEDEVGERLFERRGRRLEPTEAGRVLATHAETVLRGMDNLDTAMAGLRGLQGGYLRMGNIDAASVYVLPAMYRAFHDRYPGVRIEILVGDTARLLDALRRGDIELATTTMPIGTAEFEQLPIYRDKMQLVAHPKHVLAGKKSVTLQDVSETGLIAYPARSVTRRSIEKVFIDNGLRLNATMDIASPEAIKSLTRAGLGASILPSSIVSTEIRRGSLRTIPLPSVRFERTIGMVFRREDTLSPPARTFLDMVKKKFPDVGHPAQEHE
jgi:DNA-binding transcriptional LysR family regulator